MLSFSFIDPVLSVYLMERGMQEDKTGFAFGMIGIAIMVASPVAGILSEKFPIRYVMFFGLIGMATGIFFVGPCTFFGFMPEPPVWIIFMGLFIDGFSAAHMYIPTCPEIMIANTSIEKARIRKELEEMGIQEPELSIELDQRFKLISGIIADKASAL